MNPKEIYYEATANTIIENLKKRQMEGFYCKTSKEAVKKACSFFQPGDTVSFGGSETLNECGMLPLLRERDDITLLDRAAAASKEETEEIFRKVFSADCYFMSTNAITLEGELVNIDGRGNRVSALIFGPQYVVVMAGMNKVVSNLTDAYNRVKNFASPPNCIRLGLKTPCTSTGYCNDCHAPDCICSQTVITRRSMLPNRIKIILIGEELGY